ncbi:ribbon-helix-helix protein, CopG family [Halobacillus karajensis]|uniref:Ribbon-helix-helix protein CopG domain-containing protein n=1 Tax=Halobacillus karajensis TaxID=195088 RepID=A0A059NW99_9BACI|nr:ribbon-helix-helix protein, CopG family [Halobacillus karajensis]CDQ22615.1 hypothetical protein BN983_00828 [Halobacillus karajensis]CDQ26097.1 hypothetical protein BN981_00308 [Halobacillus karajensis]
MTEMKNVSVLLDEETVEKIIHLQKKTGTFSRSSLLRDLIKRGLEMENEK